MKAEKERLEATVFEQAAELALLKKRSLGIDGNLKGKYIVEDSKGALIALIDEVCSKYSVTIKYCCQKFELDVKRYQRRVRLYCKSGRYGGGRPCSPKAPHKLLHEEREKIIEMAKDDRYADLSHRQLAMVTSENREVEASTSSFYRVVKQGGLMEKRQRRSKTSQRKP